MENKAHALAAGIFVTTVTALLLGMAAWLTRDTGIRDAYLISTKETVTGLQAQAPVRSTRQMARSKKRRMALSIVDVAGAMRTKVESVRSKVKQILRRAQDGIGEFVLPRHEERTRLSFRGTRNLLSTETTRRVDHPSSSIERGQLACSSRESDRSASKRPPVWHTAQ